MKILLISTLMILGGCAYQADGLLSTRELRNYRALAPGITRDMGMSEFIDLVALSPYPPGPPGPIAIGILEGCPVVGEARITGREEILRLAESLAEGIRNVDRDVFMCFNPRHGIRYVAGGKQVVMLVCFECRRGQIFAEGKKIEFLTAAAPEPTWDAIFATHGLFKVK